MAPKYYRVKRVDLPSGSSILGFFNCAAVALLGSTGAPDLGEGSAGGTRVTTGLDFDT